MSKRYAPIVAPNTQQEALARAAAKAGMTVAQWVAYTDQLEAEARERRRIARQMREVPRYREAAA